MKRSQLHESYPDQAIEDTKWHLSMIGKASERRAAIEILDAIVRNNPNFLMDLHIEDTVKAFFSAIHYGSHELKSATLSAHARSMSAFLEARSITQRPATTGSASCPEKPYDWRYDKDAPLPRDITKDKAYELLHILKDVYGSDVQRILRSPYWQHYIDKLKSRYHNLA